ncbi:MAG: hypothetical protein WEB60_07870 [Terrimicrobiaceae bacterium]
MEQLVILVIIGLISLVNWLMQRSAQIKEKRRLEKAAQQGEPVETFDSEPSFETQEERPDESMRKLMEALGLPVEEPPPPIPQRVEAPPAPRDVPMAPVSTPNFSHKRLAEPPREVFVHEIPQILPPRRRPAIVEVAEPSRFRTLLSTNEGIRDAFVLAEVLAKPVSMQRR